MSCHIITIRMLERTDGATSGHLVPAGAQRLEEAEAVDGDQGGGIQDTELLVLLRTPLAQG